MSEIGKYFDFEDSYKPINLKFSLNSFDLYHDGEKERFIYVQWEVVQIGFIAILLYF